MKRFLAAITLLFCMLVFASCGQGESVSSSPSASYDSPTISVAPVLDVELENLLTVEQVSELIGAEVGQPQVFEDGTWVQYRSEDYRISVDINMQDGSEELFNTYIELYYPDAVDDEESGEFAKWSEQNQELVVLAKTYMIGIKVTNPDVKSDQLREDSRRLMNALVAAIPS